MCKTFGNILELNNGFYGRPIFDVLMVGLLCKVKCQGSFVGTLCKSNDTKIIMEVIFEEIVDVEDLKVRYYIYYYIIYIIELHISMKFLVITQSTSKLRLKGGKGLFSNVHEF